MRDENAKRVGVRQSSAAFAWLGSNVRRTKRQSAGSVQDLAVLPFKLQVMRLPKKLKPKFLSFARRDSMKPLFNGKDLNGWYSFLKTKGKNNDPEKIFSVEDGLLHISGKEFGYICTEKIYKNFLPGPVTVISKSTGIVDKRLESESSTLGIRIPKYDLMLKIIEQFGQPITTTSANSSGKKTPYSIQDILNNIFFFLN